LIKVKFGSNIGVVEKGVILGFKKGKRVPSAARLILTKTEEPSHVRLK
jgi:hypothetical protein